MKGDFAESAIIFAPRGRDAAVAGAMLNEAAIRTRIVTDIIAFLTELKRGAGFALVTEEALRGADLRGIAAYIESQPEWSDFPFILLTERGGGLERNPAAGRFLEMLGNVTFLERPFHPTTLVSLSRSALRARRRQYDGRARLEAIREGEERLRVALAAGRMGAWTLDVSKHGLDASIDCKAHFGRGPDDPFDYADLLASIHEDDRAGARDAMTASLRDAVDYDIEYRCIWPDGSTHWIQVRGRPDRYVDNVARRMTGVSHDVTDRKEVEAALRGFATELERRVEERTREREIAVAQLHEAQKLETLGQLTGGVAHDFNNLLTPVIGGLDLLRRLHRDDKSQRLIGGALQASERARILVSRLLAFARRQNLEARAVDIVALVDGMVDLMKRSLGPHIEIAIERARDLPAAMVDPNQLELALLNLALNARDAMPDGGPLRITISQHRLKEERGGLLPGNYIRLLIADSGEGMDEATLKRAIEPFYSTKGIGKGTGLGLSMVHGLAAQSGGALLLDSVRGKGTTAELWLPVAGAVAAPFQAAPDDSVPSIEPLSILLVDDEEIVRLGTADMLIDMGHAVTEVPSGADAMAMLRRRSFDLLITDYLMPGMNGADLAAEAHKTLPELPILLVTGFADFAEGAAQNFARLAKPFRQIELARMLSRIAAGEAASGLSHA
ncbi:MAG: response regulator [Sphingomonas sp.]|nr:response regulator [Sphingomonas sp.]